MAQKSLKNLLLDYLKLRYPAKIDHWTIEEFGKGWGYLGDTCRRRADDLVDEGLVERTVERGSNGREYRQYRYKMPSDENGLRSFAQDTGRRRLERVHNGKEWVMRELIVPISV